MLFRSSTTPIEDSVTVNNSTLYYAGAYIRNYTTTKKPSLTCPRNNADVYTTSAATTGNKQLAEPIALVTADEATFAGSDLDPSASPSSSYRTRSFLCSVESIWLLSPFGRTANGNAGAFGISSNGGLTDYNVGMINTLGVRPAISLSPGAIITSGTGIATDPWEVSW